MKKTLVTVVVCMFVVLGAWVHSRSAEGPDPQIEQRERGAPLATPESAEQDWRTFRTAFPLHMQTLAVAREGEAVRTLIISEPPPHVELQKLIAVAPDLLGNAEVKQWTVGFDGWVRDIVVRLPKLSDQEFAHLRDQLSEYLFSTSYKAYVLELPLGRNAVDMKYPLDVRVQTADLERWYSAQRFVPDGAPGRSLVLSAAGPGVYMSETPGLVVWIVPKNGIENYAGECRRFALDSDLILGAVGRKDSVAVFGRERVAPLTALPPLRFETVRDLASAKEDSLAQSYERNLFGAGPCRDGWDWAPIYLSDLLLDTEYGSLLNQADQMLKGWSLCGLAEYHNFPCLPPARMPFDQALIKQLKASRLLFNWNTTGFGVCSKAGDLTLYATTRTGALPVTYMTPNQDEEHTAAIIKAEDQAYAYYAGLNEPVLARVVQYTSLYQVFHATTVVAPLRTTPHWDQSDSVRKLVFSVLGSVRRLSPDKCGPAVDRYVAANDAEIHKALEGLGAPDAVIKAFRDRVISGVQQYQDYSKKYGNKGDRIIASLAGQTRSSVPPDLSALFDDDANEIADALPSIVRVGLCDAAELQRMFSGSRPKSAEGWIRTPTIVVSRTLGAAKGLTGGHNVDSTVKWIVRDSSVEVGSVRVAEGGMIHVNPKNASLLEGEARMAARSASPGELKAAAEKLLASAHPAPERPLGEILGRGDGLKPKVRGASPDVHLPQLADHGGGGAVPPGNPPPPPGTFPGAAGGDSQANRFVVGAGDKEVLHVSRKDGIAIVERRRNGKPIEGSRREHWSDWNLSNAMLEELRGGGRSLDGMPMEVLFEDSSIKDVENYLEHLVMQFNRGEFPKGAVHCSPEARQLLNEPVISASATTTSRAGAANASLLVGVTVKTQRGRIRMAVCLREVNGVTEARVQRIVGDALDAGVRLHVTHEEMPARIRESLVHDLNALDDWTGGASYIDMGDHKATRLDTLPSEFRLASAGEVGR